MAYQTATQLIRKLFPPGKECCTLKVEPCPKILAVFRKMLELEGFKTRVLSDGLRLEITNAPVQVFIERFSEDRK